MTTNQPTVSANEVLRVIQQRFPREYEIAAQQVYIAHLEQQAQQSSGEDDTDE